MVTVPVTAMIVPKMMKIQSIPMSHQASLDPKSFKCAAAGKITLTVIVQISPTKEQMKLNDGQYIATSKERSISTILIMDDQTSIALSEWR